MNSDRRKGDRLFPLTFVPWAPRLSYRSPIDEIQVFHLLEVGILLSASLWWLHIALWLLAGKLQLPQNVNPGVWFPQRQVVTRILLAFDIVCTVEMMFLYVGVLYLTAHCM